MRLVHVIASLGFCSWVAALPSPEVQARDPAVNRPDPLCTTTTKHTTTSTKKATTTTKHSTSSTKKVSSTSTKTLSSTTKKASSTSSKKPTSTSSLKPTSSTKASSKTSTSLVPSVTSKISTSSKASTTSLPALSSPILSLSVSIPVTIPTSLIPSLTSSILPPVSSPPVVPVCVPPTGEAVTNGGFASGDLTGWTLTNANSPDVYDGYVYEGDGLAADTGNTNAFRHQAQEAGTYTLSLSQTLCLVPGIPHTVSFHTGVIVFPNPLNEGTGATYALSANGEELKGPTYYCGAEIPAKGTNNYGSCTEPGAGNGYLQNYYEQTTLTYVPTAEEVTFTFQFTYTEGPTANNEANVFDLFSVTQAGA